MRCPKVRKLLPLYVGGDLESGDLWEVEAHLGGCGECGWEAARYRETWRLRRMVGEQEENAAPPVELWDALEGSRRASTSGLVWAEEDAAAKATEDRREESAERFGRVAGWARFAAVALLGVGLGVVASRWIGSFDGVSPERSRRAQDRQLALAPETASREIADGSPSPASAVRASAGRQADEGEWQLPLDEETFGRSLPASRGGRVRFGLPNIPTTAREKDPFRGGIPILPAAGKREIHYGLDESWFDPEEFGAEEF